MRAQIVRIGNSRGVRVPKALLESCGFDRDVDLSVENRALVIRRHRAPREGWAEAFVAMAAASEDQLLDPATATRFDRTEWEW